MRVIVVVLVMSLVSTLVLAQSPPGRFETSDVKKKDLQAGDKYMLPYLTREQEQAKQQKLIEKLQKKIVLLEQKATVLEAQCPKK